MTIRLRAAGGSMLRRLLLLSSGLFLLWLALQWGSMPPTPLPPAPISAADSTLTLHVRPEPALSFVNFRYGMVLLVLVAGTVLAFYLRRRTRSFAASSLLQPLGQLSLGPGQQIRLVACGDELLILGITPHQITLLKSLPLPSELQTGGMEPLPPSSFTQLLTHLSTRSIQTNHAS